MADLTDLEKQSLEEIQHPALPEGSTLHPSGARIRASGSGHAAVTCLG